MEEWFRAGLSFAGAVSDEITVRIVFAVQMANAERSQFQ